MVIKNWYNI